MRQITPISNPQSATLLLSDPPGTSDSPLISPSFSSGQRNRAYWASQPQKSVTLQPQPVRGGDHEVWEDMWWHWRGEKSFFQTNLMHFPLLRPFKTIPSRIHNTFRSTLNFYGEKLLATRPNIRCRTTPLRPSATTHSVYSQLTSHLDALSFSATWRRATSWRHRNIYHRLLKTPMQNNQSL